MEKRLLLSMVLCLLILLVYQFYTEKQNERWKAARQEAEREGLQEIPVDLDRLDSEGVVASQGLAEGLREEEGELSDASQDVRCEEVVVDTPLYQAVFCSRNGRPMRWTLKNYQLNKVCECPVPGFRKAGLPDAPDGGSPAWVERIHAQGPEEYPLALEISTGRDKRIPSREALEPDRVRLDLNDGEQPARIPGAGRSRGFTPSRRIRTWWASKLRSPGSSRRSSRQALP